MAAISIINTDISAFLFADNVDKEDLPVEEFWDAFSEVVFITFFIAVVLVFDVLMLDGFGLDVLDFISARSGSPGTWNDILHSFEFMLKSVIIFQELPVYSNGNVSFWGFYNIEKAVLVSK